VNFEIVDTDTRLVMTTTTSLFLDDRVDPEATLLGFLLIDPNLAILDSLVALLEFFQSFFLPFVDLLLEINVRDKIGFFEGAAREGISLVI
jgi:hypothetical protein